MSFLLHHPKQSLSRNYFEKGSPNVLFNTLKEQNFEGGTRIIIWQRDRITAEGKEKPNFILWNLNPSYALYLKYVSNVLYARRDEFVFIKWEQSAGRRGNGNKGYFKVNWKICL